MEYPELSFEIIRTCDVVFEEFGFMFLKYF